MINLRGIELSNVVSFDSARFSFDEGLTVVYGQNDDASRGKKSNGSGKSLLFTTLVETLLDSHPLITGRQAQKDAFYRKNAACRVVFDDYRLTKHRPAASLQYELEKKIKGKWTPTKTRTKNFVTEKMAELVPIGLDEFYTLYYIDSTRQSIIQRGTSTERFRLLSTLFNLDRYDEMGYRIKELTKQLKKEEAVLIELQDQLASIRHNLKNKSLKAAADSLPVIKQKHAKATEAVTELHNQLSVTKMLVSSRDSIEYLSSVFSCTELDVLANVHNDYAQFVDDKKAAKIGLAKEEKKHEKYLKHVAKLEHLAKLKRELDDFGISHEDSERYVEAQGHVSGLEKELKSVDDYLDSVPVTDKPEDSYALLSKHNIDAIKKELAAEKASYDNESLLISTLKQVKGKTCCPTCSTTLNPSKTADLLDAATDRHAACKKKVRKLELLAQELSDAENQVRLYEKHADGLSLYKERKSNITGKLTKYRKIVKGYNPKKMEKYLDAVVLYELVNADIVSASKPKEANVSKAKSKYDKLTEIVTHLKALKPIATSLERLYNSDTKVSASYDVIEGKLEKSKQLADTLLTEMNELSKSAGMYSTYKEQLSTVKKRIENMGSIPDDIRLLKILEQAYSNKGLKNIVTARFCSSIERNLNAYSPLLFSEQVRFQIEVETNNLNILITRTLHGEVVTTDVRRLSGAETRHFNLLFAIAVLPLIPEHRRLNVMILDEPAANSDSQSIDMLCSKFLPKLKELVPCTVVISPVELPLDDEDANFVTVKRSNGISEIKKGRL